MKVKRRRGNNEKFDFYTLLSPSHNAEIKAVDSVSRTSCYTLLSLNPELENNKIKNIKPEAYTIGCNK